MELLTDEKKAQFKALIEGMPIEAMLGMMMGARAHAAISDSSPRAAQAAAESTALSKHFEQELEDKRHPNRVKLREQIAWQRDVLQNDAEAMRATFRASLKNFFLTPLDALVGAYTYFDCTPEDQNFFAQIWVKEFDTQARMRRHNWRVVAQRTNLDPSKGPIQKGFMDDYGDLIDDLPWPLMRGDHPDLRDYTDKLLREWKMQRANILGAGPTSEAPTKLQEDQLTAAADSFLARFWNLPRGKVYGAGYAPVVIDPTTGQHAAQTDELEARIGVAFNSHDEKLNFLHEQQRLLTQRIEQAKAQRNARNAPAPKRAASPRAQPQQQQQYRQRQPQQYQQQYQRGAPWKGDRNARGPYGRGDGYADVQHEEEEIARNLENKRCHNCHEWGHIRSMCPGAPKPQNFGSAPASAPGASK